MVAEIREVNQHPDADKLTLCQLDDGTGEHTILCGAPNIRHYIGQGRLEKPFKVAYVREGGVVYDGHKPGWELTKINAFSKVYSMYGIQAYRYTDWETSTDLLTTDYYGTASFVSAAPGEIRLVATDRPLIVKDVLTMRCGLPYCNSQAPTEDRTMQSMQECMTDILIPPDSKSILFGRLRRNATDFSDNRLCSHL